MTVRPSRQEIHSKTIAFKANHDRSFTNYKAIDLKLYDFVEEKLEWTDDEWAAVSLLEFTKEMNEILKVENPSQRWVTTWQLRQRMNYMRRALQVLSKNPHFKGTNRGLEDLLRFSSEEDHWSVIFRTVEYPGLLYQYIFNQFNTLALSNSLVAVKETGKYLTSDAEMKDRVEKYLEFSQEYLGENSIISISGVYLLLDATSPIDSFNDFVTSIFYIGCGIPTRPVTHIRYATSESTSANKSPTGLKIKEIWNSGNKVVVFQPYDELTKREALIIEESLISTVGFSQLVNSMLGVKVPPANEFSNEIRQAYGANKLLQAYKLYQQSEPILITREIAQKSTNARKSLITKPKP
ncbi:hypothetical protein M3Y95_00289900 [Aphelenchoides besseyi]|nr:hypothetical protein M3Y95_00289900 [Aphelenchoides besseyi]